MMRLLSSVVMVAAAVVFAESAAGNGVSANAGPARPHVIFILTDDMGYGAARNPEIHTPALDQLAAEGVTVESFYTYRFCAPSRGSFLTGRYPWRLPSTRCNFLPATIQDGTPLSYTMLPARLATAAAGNYTTAHVGKWHQGLYAPEYTPLYRGFQQTDGFLSGGEDHFQQYGDLGVGNCGNGSGIRDIWVHNATAPQLIGQYTGTRFSTAAVRIIEGVAADNAAAAAVGAPQQPLFMYLALHNTHSPLQSLPQFYNMYKNVSFEIQRQYYAMMSTVDSTVGNVTAALKQAGMWDNTLVVWASDNGAPVQVGGSNYPLRGGKGSNWEGGVRTPPAIFAGGALPASQAGKQLSNGFMHIVDLYATLLSVAGVTNASDPSPTAPVQIDSLNFWPWISGANTTCPRTELVLDHSMYDSSTQGVHGAMRVGQYKLLVGGPGGEPQASWYGHFSPNASDPNPSIAYAACGNNPNSTGTLPGCVFDLDADPTEHVDLAPSQPDLFRELLAQFQSYNATYHPPNDNPPSDGAALCKAALAAGGIVTPWRSPLPEHL